MGDLTAKLWANSGDSHLMEPPDLFASLPEDIRERLPRSVKDPSGDFETIYIDGQVFRRDLPKSDKPKKGLGINARPIDSEEDDFITRVIGGNDPVARIKDLDKEGVWGEVMYPSLGIWTSTSGLPRVVKEGCRALNDWALEFQRHSPRFVCVASIPLIDIDDAVAEVKRAHEGGFLCGFLPVRPPIGRPEWNDEEWDPLWDAFAETGMVIGFHIGTEPHDPTERTGVYYRGRGGAVLNYVETTYGGQRAVTQLIACGALDRHPELKVLVSEGGATWGPFIADRMDEGYRQHGAAVAHALQAAQPVPLRPGVRLLPARHLRRGRQLGHGVAQRPVGQRLPALRGHVRPHPEDAARALRRGRPRGEPACPDRRLPGALPERSRATRSLSQQPLHARRHRRGDRRTTARRSAPCTAFRCAIECT